MQPETATHRGRRPTWDNSLVGTLETWPLSDVILWLHQTGRSAMIRIGNGIHAGVLFIQDGQLYRVEWGKLAGEEALIGLLGLRHGSFTLLQRAPPEAIPNIRRSTPELLLQLAVAQDERNRAHQA